MATTKTKKTKDDGVTRWVVLGPRGAHIAASSKEGVTTAKCGAKGKVTAEVGSLPAHRRPPCAGCAD